jgi:putative FmdB family regulatory protein
MCCLYYFEWRNKLPLYSYRCSECEVIIEARLPMTEYLLPETLPCQSCGTEKTVKIFLSSPPAIGDPIRLGITHPPEAFTEGVLGRMKRNIPDRATFTPDGKIKSNKINFNKAQYQPR